MEQCSLVTWILRQLLPPTSVFLDQPVTFSPSNSSTMKRSHGACRSAFAANTVKTRLYAVSHVAILNIARSLNDEEKISFALSSVTIYKTLRDAKLNPVHMSRTAKTELHKQLKRDTFYAGKVRLFLTTKVRGQAWCAACACTHSLRQFPPTLSPLSTPREQKMCFLAIDGGLTLCRHTWCSFDDVNSLAKSHRSSAWTRSTRLPECQHCITSTSLSYIIPPTIDIKPTGKVELWALVRLFFAPEYYEVPAWIFTTKYAKRWSRWIQCSVRTCRVLISMSSTGCLSL